MEKCKCYQTRTVNMTGLKDCDGYKMPWYETYTEGYCIGTKECELCRCNGDKSKCDFYEDVRKEAKGMNTAEMWTEAQKDGKTYTNGEMIYNRDTGFLWDDGSDAEELDETYTRSDVLSSVDWRLDETMMTKSEAEAKFNIKIVG